MTRKKSHKKISSAAENPFNIKVNRRKHSVLNQKVKGTQGLPVVSRSLGYAKRKKEFHKKRTHSLKANTFVDKRLIDNSLSFEEQASLRLVEERKKKFKKNIFNLNENESLTHKGVPLDFQNKLDNTVHDSDDDEPLDPNFVRQAHFGGFAQGTASKSRKEIIDELIVESKRKKIERQLEREKNENLIEQLDQQWKELHHAFPDMKTSKQKDIPESKGTSSLNDPYDIVFQELKFEVGRARPSEPEKTPEEIEKEERERVKKLEEERYKRMMNTADDVAAKTDMLSADSIYDGLDIEFEPVVDEEYSNTNANEGHDDDDKSSDESSSEDENDEFNDTSEKHDVESVSTVKDDTSDFPDNVEKLCNIVDEQDEELCEIIENLIKDRIKSKSKQNLANLEEFFAVVIEYIMNLSNSSNTLELLDSVLPHLYRLAEFSPINTASKILAFLDAEQDIFQQSKGKKMKRNFPRFQSLVLFKVISAIYSVSDFKHPIVTPSIVFMCDILSSPYSMTFQNSFSRLFICEILYDCVSFSKRYVPEVFWFLNKTLELALCNSKRFNLFIDNAVMEEETVEVRFENTNKTCSNFIKANIIFEIINLLKKFSSLYEPLQCYKEIFHELISTLKQLPITNYPNFLNKVLSEFIESVESLKKTYKPLTFENKKPVPLKLFEPAFDSKFNWKKDDIPKKRKLVKRINQKIKKEERSLLREMRRENQVITSEKLKERIEADEERKRKVRQLYGELATQEGEYKKFVKKK